MPAVSLPIAANRSDAISRIVQLKKVATKVSTREMQSQAAVFGTNLSDERYMVSGNSRTHTLKLVQSNGADLPGDEDASSLSNLFEATLPVACGEIDD